jgi:arabinose-5-phosphate isomerase
MHTGERVPRIRLGARMADAIMEMSSKGFGCVGVFDASGALAGIITDGDLRRAMGPDLLQQSVGAVMTQSPLTIGPEALAAEALRLMNGPQRAVTALFVVDAAHRPVGILHIHDLLRAGVV